MENKIVFKDKEVSKIDSRVLGVSGENKQQVLVFKIDEGFIDGTAFLELILPTDNCCNNKKHSIEVEKDVEKECYQLEVKRSLLRYEGVVKMQLKIISNGVEVYKTAIFDMHVMEAINASEEFEEDYPCFVEQTKVELQELQEGFEQVCENLKGTKEEIEQVKKETEGSIKEETDPTVPAHVKSITEENIESWNNKSDFSGNYEDLENKPELPSVEGLATESYVNEKIGEIPKNDFDKMSSNDVSNLVEEYRITIENGKFISPEWAVGKTSIVVDKGSLVQVEANEGFNAWQDEKGTVRNSSSYEFLVTRDMKLTAVSLEEKEPIFRVSGNQYSDPYRAEFFLDWDIPENYTILQTDFVISYVKNGENKSIIQQVNIRGNYNSGSKYTQPFENFAGYTVFCQFIMNLTNAENESIALESEIMTFNFVEQKSKLAGEEALLETYQKLNTKIENVELDFNEKIGDIDALLDSIAEESEAI